MNKLTRRLVLIFVLLLALFAFLVNHHPPANSIQVRDNLSAQELDDLDVEKWGTWKKEPSTFIWQFPELETIYVTKGEVHVTPLHGSQETVHIQKGDYATFAPGLRATWHVTQPFEKQVILADTPLTNIYWRVVFKAKAAWRHVQALFKSDQSSQS